MNDTAALRKPVVLAIDDEPAILSTFQRNFRSLFEIHVAANGERALELLERIEPDLVVSDLAMPGMTGITLLERVAARRPKAVRVLATAYGRAPNVLEAQRRGICSWIISKPWSRAIILDTFEKALVARTLDSDGARYGQ